MMCQRCQGLMVFVTLKDIEGTVMREPTLGWRCLLCGGIVDPAIAENRKSPPKPLPRRPVPRFGPLLGVAGNRGPKDKRDGGSRSRRDGTGYPLVRR